MRMRVVAVVLAAGSSRRLGRPKQLVAFRGTALVRRAVEAAVASRCQRVVVVTGAYEESVRAALGGLPIFVTFNEDWEEGMASSIRRGVREAEREGCEGVLLMVCDQPAVSPEHLDRLVLAHRAGAAIVASRYGGVLGVPAVFGESLFPSLRGLRGAEGAKHLLRSSSEAGAIDWPEGTFDVDTENDALRVQRFWS
jgi:CTP:molybdopterin cytidylyltransferase MocA